MTENSDSAPAWDAKVAAVNGSTELVLNRGINSGVEEGDTFAILASETSDVPDPDTGEPLGRLREVLAVVKVVEVGTRFCVARTFRNRSVRISTGLGVSSMFQPPKYETRLETVSGVEPGDLAIPAKESHTLGSHVIDDLP